MSYVFSLAMTSPCALQRPTPCKPLSDGGVIASCLLGLLGITSLGSSNTHPLLPPAAPLPKQENPREASKGLCQRLADKDDKCQPGLQHLL